MKCQSSEFPEWGAQWEETFHRCSLWVMFLAVDESHPVWFHFSSSLCTSGQLWAPAGATQSFGLMLLWPLPPFSEPHWGQEASPKLRGGIYSQLWAASALGPAGISPEISWEQGALWGFREQLPELPNRGNLPDTERVWNALSTGKCRLRVYKKLSLNNNSRALPGTVFQGTWQSPGMSL